MQRTKASLVPALAALFTLVPVVGCESGSTPVDTDSAADTEDDAEPAPTVRVRRSWTTLTPAERKQYIDGVLALKQKRDLRWDYESACADQPGAPEKTAYDYYVEIHIAAFAVHHGGPRAHMGPQFLTWHREFLRRYEEELREVLGDPDFMLPYWDWTDDPAKVFSAADLGDIGACPAGPQGDFGAVQGYLTDGGFVANVWSNAALPDNPLACEPKPLTRGPGCIPLAPDLPTAAQIAKAFEIPTYDVEPFDSTNTDEQLSFRQYLEGYTNEDDEEPSGVCALAGCQMHGRVHMWVGGMLGSAAGPNDPVFFLHHANVDRIWAEWQDRYGDATYPSEAPHDYSGEVFSFIADDGAPVLAADLFDHRALGYIYSTQTP